MWNFIHNALYNPKKKSFKVFHDVLAVIIIVSTLLIILETVPRLAGEYAQFFYYADLIVVLFFGIEYIVRIVTDKHPGQYVTSPLGIIDLLAFLPSLFLFVFPLGFAAAVPTVRTLRIIRSIRILRLLRVVRLVRFFGSKKRGKDRVERAGALLPFINIEIYFFALFIIVTFSASLMYLIEGNIAGTAFKTIPDGMWWAITTVTTVGYGDMVPITAAGKVVASLTMLSGFALLALLLSVVGPALQTLLFGTRIDKSEIK